MSEWKAIDEILIDEDIHQHNVVIEYNGTHLTRAVLKLGTPSIIATSYGEAGALDYLATKLQHIVNDLRKEAAARSVDPVAIKQAKGEI